MGLIDLAGAAGLAGAGRSPTLPTQDAGLFKLRRPGSTPSGTCPRSRRRRSSSWFAERPLRNGGGRRVLLWADTFNNYFQPEDGKAAVEVLEDAGFQVVVPQGHLCCGRPLYDYGMLDLAEALPAQDARRAAATRSAPARRSSGSSRAASPSSATSC